MSMFSFGRPILLVSMGTRHMVFNAYTLKERVEFLVCTSPVRLESKDLFIKGSFNMILKIMKAGKNIRFILNKIDPSKLAIVINEAYIILVASNRSTSRTPHIGENEL